MNLIIGKAEQGREKSNVIKLGFWDGDTLGELLFFLVRYYFQEFAGGKAKSLIFNLILILATYLYF